MGVYTAQPSMKTDGRLRWYVCGVTPDCWTNTSFQNTVINQASAGKVVMLGSQ
jgi:hypothetical protein